MNLPQKLETKYHKSWKQNTAKVGNKMPQKLETNINIWSSDRGVPLDAPVTIIFLPSVNSMVKPLLNKGTKWKNEFEQWVTKNEGEKRATFISLEQVF